MILLQNSWQPDRNGMLLYVRNYFKYQEHNRISVRFYDLQGSI